MGYADAKWAILGALGVYVDPLVVARRVGKGVDALLRDTDPVGGAQVVSHSGQHAGHRVKTCRGFGFAHVQACCELTDTTSPVI